MPLYFFNVFDDREYIKDNHGVELADVEQAKAELSRLPSERRIRTGSSLQAIGFVPADPTVSAPG